MFNLIQNIKGSHTTSTNSSKVSDGSEKTQTWHVVNDTDSKASIAAQPEDKHVHDIHEEQNTDIKAVCSSTVAIHPSIHISGW